MILRGEKTILRPIAASHLPRFVRWLRDDDVRKGLSGNPKGPTLKQEKAWFAGLPKKKKSEKHFAIDTKDGLHIGSASLRLDVTHKRAEIGILIGDKQAWGRGYGKEVMVLLMRYGFEKLKLHRIELGVYAYNTRAIALYKKLGFKLEGKKRDFILWKGKFYDELLMGMLAKEWDGGRTGFSLRVSAQGV